MLTYANDNSFGRLLYGTINQTYASQLENYLSIWINNAGKVWGQCPSCPTKDGIFITCYPPTGDVLCDLYESAATLNLNYQNVSDVNRHTREIQSVGCKLAFAQDHMMELTRNYQPSLGAFVVWDGANENNEIACVVLVRSTKTSNLAHAAKALARRTNFKPPAMYSDTWPNKECFWKLLFGTKLKGRLGLFHFTQRIIKTLCTNHIDYQLAIKELLQSIYCFHEKDYKALLVALQEGKLSLNRRKYSIQEIEDMKVTSVFKN